MTEKEVVELMSSSKSEQEWDANCNTVKRACGGYPEFWFRAIILSGLAKRVSATWGGTDEIYIL